MSVNVTNVEGLETVSLASTASEEVSWTGGYFSYGGSQAADSATIYFAVPPGGRLGEHTDTAEETQFVLAGSGELLLEDGVEAIRAGDVFVLQEGVRHDLRNTGNEDLRVIAFFSRPEVEQHWTTDTWPPDDTRVTGSPNRD